MFQFVDLHIIEYMYHEIWHSWVEIEHYSVVYFARITAFEALYSVELPLRAGLIRTG